MNRKERDATNKKVYIGATSLFSVLVRFPWENNKLLFEPPALTK